ncbi:hypothetical protein [Bordetella holmesii]|uniref:hypothetical protein n=1 Tax=Bordetella holmesii TaxID=35814 RepID=UPI000C7823D0|nr:hypothetical protein [Bordetella holmesii]AUL36645.1 hypothetical protein BTL52_11135 [Bordetella holmesii]
MTPRAFTRLAAATHAGLPAAWVSRPVTQVWLVGGPPNAWRAASCDAVASVYCYRAAVARATAAQARRRIILADLRTLGQAANIEIVLARTEACA